MRNHIGVPAEKTLFSDSNNNELFIINSAAVQADEYLFSGVRKAILLVAIFQTFTHKKC
jgi:hypothetical protein